MGSPAHRDADTSLDCWLKSPGRGLLGAGFRSPDSVGSMQEVGERPKLTARWDLHGLPKSICGFHLGLGIEDARNAKVIASTMAIDSHCKGTRFQSRKGCCFSPGRYPYMVDAIAPSDLLGASCRLPIPEKVSGTVPKDLPSRQWMGMYLS